jgi:RNA polymerase-binding transcription factor DksA
VSDAAIVKRAKRDDWSRDLRAKIQAKADAKVSAALVSAEVSEKAALTEKVVVEVEAQVQSRIRLAHRADIGRGRTLVMNLLGELETVTGARELFEQLGELMANPDDKGAADKLNEAYHKVIGLSGRIKGAKELAEALRTLVTLERQAYGIGEDSNGGGDYERMLEEVHRAVA